MGKEETGIQSVTLKDFSGGLNSNWLSSAIQDNEARSCNNVIWKNNYLTLSPGYIRYAGQIGGSGGTSAIRNITDFRMRDGTQYLFVISSDTAWYYDTTTNAFADITGALTISDYRYRSIVFNNEVIATNGDEPTLVWTGAGNCHDLVDDCGADIPPASAKYIATFNGRVILLNYVDGVTPRPTRACYSNVDNQNFWDLTLNFWEVDGDDGDEITGGHQLGDNFVIFTNNTLNIVSGAGTPWQVTRGFVKGIGCVSGDSIAHGFIRIANTLIECLTFMSHDGPKAFDGTTIYNLPINEENQPYKCQDYIDTINEAYKTRTESIYYPKRNWILTYTTSDTSTTNDGGFIIVPDNNALWPIDNINASCIAKVWSEIYKTYDIFVGTYDGIIYYMSETTHTSDHSTELITNGNMEAATGGICDNWTEYGDAAMTTARSAVQAYTLTYSNLITTNSIGDGIYQDITTVVGSRYRAYAYIFGDTVHNCCLEKMDTDGTNVVTSTYAILSKWTRLTIDFTATSTTSRIIIRDVDIGPNVFYIDDVSVRCIDCSWHWQSRDFDYGDEAITKYLREFVPFLTYVTGGNLLFRITYNKATGGTSTDLITYSAGEIDWTSVDWSLIDWTSGEEGSIPMVFTQDMFRTHNLYITGGDSVIDFRLNKIISSAKEIGKRWFTCA